MALFSSGNRKVRSRRPKTAQELGKAQPPDAVNPRHLRRRSDELGKQIHRLECLIADAPRLQKAQRLATLDTLPPLAATPVNRGRRKMTLAQRQEINGRRLWLAVEWTVVGAGIAAVVGWLNQWFHFWSL
jgi:hypothetical protein